jgi:hypothetical protein
MRNSHTLPKTEWGPIRRQLENKQVRCTDTLLRTDGQISTQKKGKYQRKHSLPFKCRGKGRISYNMKRKRERGAHSLSMKQREAQVTKERKCDRKELTDYQAWREGDVSTYEKKASVWGVPTCYACGRMRQDTETSQVIKWVALTNCQAVGGTSEYMKNNNSSKQEELTAYQTHIEG